MTTRWSFRANKALGVFALSVPVFAAFAACLFLLAFIIACYRDTALDDAGTLTVACVCLLISSLFLIVFHVKHETVLVPCKNRQDFLTKCRLVLQDLGYEVHDKSMDQLVSWPSFWAFLLGGRIHVDATSCEATITGPKVFVEILRRRLRLQSHLATVEPARVSRLRHGERLLKRVQISLRVTPEQWSEVGLAVLEQLAAEGAQVFCEVHLMAQSDEGISESFVDGPLRDWFKQEDIQAEVHKDHARWEEPLARTANLNLIETRVEGLPCVRA